MCTNGETNDVRFKEEAEQSYFPTLGVIIIRVCSFTKSLFQLNLEYCSAIDVRPNQRNVANDNRRGEVNIVSIVVVQRISMSILLSGL